MKPHYLPQFWIKKWAEPAQADNRYPIKVWCRGKPQAVHKGPKSVGSEREYLKISIQGKDPDYLECAPKHQELDRYGSDVVNKMIERPDYDLLSEEEKRKLVRWVRSLQLRHPDHVKKSKIAWTSLLESEGAKWGYSRREMEEDQGGTLGELGLVGMWETTLDKTAIRDEVDWAWDAIRLGKDHGEFILGDAGVLVEKEFSPRNEGRVVRFILPLDPKTVLIGDQTREVVTELVSSHWTKADFRKLFNRMVVEASSEFVIARGSSNDRLLEKYWSN